MPINLFQCHCSFSFNFSAIQTVVLFFAPPGSYSKNFDKCTKITDENYGTLNAKVSQSEKWYVRENVLPSPAMIENADCEKHKISVDNQNDLPMNVSIKYIMIHDFRVVHQEKGIN